MPLDNTVVIPAGWSAHVRPVVTGAMTARCSLTHPGGTGKSFDDTTGSVTVTLNDPYLTDVPCLVDAGSPEGAMQLFGEQLATTITGTITLDFTTAGGADIHVDDLVAVTAVDANASPALVGRVFRVRGVAHASLDWGRVLGVTDYEG